MTELITPFFFTYDDDKILEIDQGVNYDYGIYNDMHQTTFNNINVDPYLLFCLYNEVVYWIKYHTVYQDSLLRYKDSLIYDHTIPNPIVRYGNKDIIPKTFITMLVYPMMDETATVKLQEFITSTAELRRRTACLIIDSDVYIEGVDNKWIAEALSLVTVDPGYNTSDLASHDKKMEIEHYLIRDQYTTRLYAYIDDDFDLDKRNFNERYTYLYNSIVSQLRIYWRLLFIRDPEGTLKDWPLTHIKDHWYKADVIVPRLMLDSGFFMERIRGNNKVRTWIGHNYAIMGTIAQELSNSSIKFRFIGGYIEASIDNFNELQTLGNAVEIGLETKGKVVEIEVTPGTGIAINNKYFLLKHVHNYISVNDYRNKLTAPDVSPEKLEDLGTVSIRR